MRILVRNQPRRGARRARSRIPRGTACWVALLGLVLLASSCGHALNYLDATGPVYVASYAPASTTPARPGADRPFRVVSFNIAFGVHVDRALEVLHKNEELRDFDMLALQEMDEPGVGRIARELGVSYVYIPSGVHPKNDRDFGCAILSPWRIDEPRKIVLPHAARGTGLRRVVVVATIVRGTQRIRCYSVHLSSPFGISGASRREQAQLLIADAAASPDPVIMAGDFNSYDIGHEFAAAGFTWATRDTGPTVSRFLLQFRYDHVFARDPSNPQPTFTAGVVKDNRKASDHKATWTVLEFAGRDTPAVRESGPSNSR